MMVRRGWSIAREGVTRAGWFMDTELGETSFGVVLPNRMNIADNVLYAVLKLEERILNSYNINK